MKNRFKISRWIMMSLAILTNAFIIFYSSVDAKTTKRWNDSFSNLYVSIINSITKKQEKTIALNSIDVQLSSQEEQQYNYIPGYGVDEIPLGSAKEVSCAFNPSDATNKAITYTANPSDRVVLNQSGSKVSVIGMKEGPCSITATSNDGGFVSSVNITVVDTKAPAIFNIAKTNYSISLGNPETIEFDIDGGVLTHDELITFRYYDIGKLTYLSHDTSIATVDEHGVIYPVSTGETTITVSNASITKELFVAVTSGTPPTPYSDLKIVGSNICYTNDMLMDQSSHKHHYQLTPKDGEVELDPNSFIWESYNNLLARVDRHGVLRGFRKTSFNDEMVTIKATSKITGQFVTFDVTVKNQIPSTMNVYLDYGDKKIWDKSEYTIMAGEHVSASCYYDIKVQNLSLSATTSDENVISITNEGDRVVLHALTEGECDVTIQSQLNLELTLKTHFTVVKSGAISGGEVESLARTLRKSIGHALVFTLTQIFTFITLFMFLCDKKWWLYSSISLGEGLFISFFSEFIQYLVPTRNFTFTDVLIDFTGVVVGALIAFGIVMLIKHVSKKRLEKDKKKE